MISADNQSSSTNAYESVYAHETTRSTSEAMKVLHKNHDHLIELGRDMACKMANANGTVTSRDVRSAMAEAGVLPGTREHWLGAIFRDSRFRWTGEWKTYSDSARNIHERTVKVWALK